MGNIIFQKQYFLLCVCVCVPKKTQRKYKGKKPKFGLFDKAIKTKKRKENIIIIVINLYLNIKSFIHQ